MATKKEVGIKTWYIGFCYVSDSGVGSEYLSFEDICSKKADVDYCDIVIEFKAPMRPQLFLKAN